MRDETRPEEDGGRLPDHRLFPHPSSPIPHPCYVLAGPTGSGKSALALELAGRLGAEIVCMDSMTLYRGMDIGTAKPTAEDRRRVPHHLLDVLDPHEPGTVAWWLERATECVRDIRGRGRVPLFVGGTALYLKALLQGLFDGPGGDAALRAELEEEARRDGAAAFHARLAAVDAVSAARIHPNNVRRVIRALEVHRLTGRPMSEQQTQWAGPSSSFILHPSSFPTLCIDLPRAELHRRIDERVVRMFAEGLEDEVRRLRALVPPVGKEASQALGYKELFAWLDGLEAREEAIHRVQARSRQLAKRQMTWFRHMDGVRLVRPEEVAGLWGV
jgi:tRNA dimethylallyltransferase